MDTDTSAWPLYLQIVLLIFYALCQFVLPKVLEKRRTKEQKLKEAAEVKKLEAEAGLAEAQQNKVIADTVEGLLVPAREEMERLRRELQAVRDLVVARDKRIAELEQKVGDLENGVDRLVEQVESLQAEPVYRRKKKDQPDNHNGRTK